MKAGSDRPETAARREREAEALRQNLRRRKEQARAREGVSGPHATASQAQPAKADAET